MEYPALPPSASSKKEKELRIAMALNRGMEFLAKVEKTAPSTGKLNGANLPAYILGLYRDAHSELFQDWHGNAPIESSLEIANAEKRRELENAILKHLFGVDAPKGEKRLFDDNGYTISYKKAELADIFANLYEDVSAIKPFPYGNKLTIDFFITALSRLPFVKEVYPDGIDFRRLGAEDVAALENATDKKSIKEALLHAMDSGRTPQLKNKTNGFTPFESHIEHIEAVPFLSHVLEKNGKSIECLVTANGGLVPLNVIKSKIKDFFSTNGLISEFYVDKSDIVDYLPNTDFLRNKGRKDVDGMKIKDDGSAPLVCLDADILTGLRPASNKRLVELMNEVNKREHNPKKAKVTDLNNKPEYNQTKEQYLQKYIEAANGDERLKKIINVAYDHINANVPSMDAFVEKQFEGVISQEKPRLYISMGGSGSGKSSAGNVVKQECGENSEEQKNYIKASLDDFREGSDLYKLLIAAGHHADDYNLITTYATELRDWVTNRALEKKVNLLYDGAGIDYKPRYSEIVAKFKDGGYHNQVVAIETNLPEALNRVGSRFDKEGRTLPWRITVGKHARFPTSFLDAVKDRNLDKISLITADGKTENDNFIIAETFDRAHNGLSNLNKERSGGLTKLFDGFLDSADSIKKSLPALTHNNPRFNDENTSFITYPHIGGEGKDRILAVYNIDRLKQMLGKGLTNTEASSEKGLNVIPSTAPFAVREDARANGAALLGKSH